MQAIYLNYLSLTLTQLLFYYLSVCSSVSVLVNQSGPMVFFYGSYWPWDSSPMETSTPLKCSTSSNKDTEYRSQWTAPMNFLQSSPVAGLCQKTRDRALGSSLFAWQTSWMRWAILFEKEMCGNREKRRRLLHRNAYRQLWLMSLANEFKELLPRQRRSALLLVGFEGKAKGTGTENKFRFMDT